MAARMRITRACAIDDVVYQVGSTHEVTDEIGGLLLTLGAGVAADEATAARVRCTVEWTAAPADHSHARNWVMRRQ